MTETISKDTVLFKVQLKNMIDVAIKELTDTKNRQFIKKAALSSIVIYTALFGMGMSLEMIHEGIQLLIESGVSEILINRIVGAGLWLIGMLTFVMFACGSAIGMNRWVLNSEKKETKQ